MKLHQIPVGGLLVWQRRHVEEEEEEEEPTWA